MLTSEESERYGRHLSLSAIGLTGQEKLKSASVLVVGAGGLGSPSALYLSAAGVGRIGLADPDRVELSNLQRQVLYRAADLGRLKAEAASEHLAALNSNVEVVSYPMRLDESNAASVVNEYDIVLDGTDSFAARYAINEACVRAGVPNVFASIIQFQGQASVLATTEGPCYRCIYDAPPPASAAPTCAEAGVLGVLPGLLGVIQATEALKLILGIGEGLVGRLLQVDALSMHFKTLRVAKDPDCPVCGTGAEHRRAVSSKPQHTSSPMASIPEITVEAYQRLRAADSPPFLLDVRSRDEYSIANLDGSLVPLDQLPIRLHELEEHRDDPKIVVHCRSGARSAQAVAYLHEHGFTNAVNLQGGILAWSDRIDPTIPKY